MKKINPGVHGQNLVRKFVKFRHSKFFNSVIFSKTKITEMKHVYWPLKWSMFRLNRATLSKVTTWNVGHSLRKIRKKSPTRPTWQGDYSEQARVSDLVTLLLKSYLLFIGISGFFFRFFKLPANYRNSQRNSTNR